MKVEVVLINGLKSSGRSSLSGMLRYFIQLNLVWDNVPWTCAELSAQSSKEKLVEAIERLRHKAFDLGYRRLTIIIPDAKLIHLEEWPEAFKVRLECSAYTRQIRSKSWTASDTLPEFGLSNYLHHFNLILSSEKDSPQCLAGKVLLAL